MRSDEWYYNELGITDTDKSCKNLEDKAVHNLTKHPLYGKLCHWQDIVIIYMLKTKEYTPGQNDIIQSYSLYVGYKVALTTNHIKDAFNCLHCYYNNLMRMKKKQINIYMLFDAFDGLDCDILSVIKHYNTLLFLFG